MHNCSLQFDAASVFPLPAPPLGAFRNCQKAGRKWLPYISDAPKPHTLFCIPFAGGGASSFAQLRRHAPGWLDVCPVQLPGRESRMSEAPLTAIDDVIQGLLEALLPHTGHSYSILGYSLGARIARSVVTRLQELGAGLPKALFVAAHRAPDFALNRAPIHALPSPMFWARLAAYDGTPREVLENAELRALLEPMLRADFAMAEAPMPPQRAPLECPIIAFAGTEDPFAGPETMHGWAKETRGGFDLLRVEGAHFFLRTKAHVFMDRLFDQVALRAFGPQATAEAS